jgi:hypothetical protein
MHTRANLPARSRHTASTRRPTLHKSFAADAHSGKSCRYITLDTYRTISTTHACLIRRTPHRIVSFDHATFTAQKLWLHLAASQISQPIRKAEQTK